MRAVTLNSMTTMSKYDLNIAPGGKLPVERFICLPVVGHDESIGWWRDEPC